MPQEALTPSQVREVEHIAELETRRYFDHYLKDVWPEQQRALREHTDLMIQRHDDSDLSHGRAEARLNRLLWLVAGAAAAGTGGGIGLSKVLTSVLG